MPESAPPLAPVTVAPSDIARFDGAEPSAWRFIRAWWRFAPRAKGWGTRKIGRMFGTRNGGIHARVRTASGGTLAVDPMNADIYAFIDSHGGVWEQSIQDLVKALLRPGDVLYDIGANAGVVSIDAAAHMKGACRVVAFEPIPSLARAVALSAALSELKDSFAVYEAMVGDTDGEATLYIPAHAIHASAISREKGAVALPRPLRRLDTLVQSDPQRFPPPTIIKIDVEGAELSAFTGAMDTIRGAQPIILFEADVNLERFNCTRKQLFDVLASCCPYRFYFVTDGSFVPADPDAPFDWAHTDVIALPPNRELPAMGR